METAPPVPPWDTRGTREGHGGPVCPEPLDRGGAGGAGQGRAGEPWDRRGTDTALRGRGRGAQPALTSCLCGQRAVRVYLRIWVFRARLHLSRLSHHALTRFEMALII